jgi:sodium pump decarboxylase gamma subunit
MALSFVGCSEEKVSKSTIETLEQSAEVFIGSFSQMADKDLESFKTVSDFQLNYIMMSNYLPVTGENFLAIINSWQAAEAECGEYVGHGDYVVEATNDGYEVSTEAEYKNRKATILFVFDENMNVESMGVSAKFSMGEVLTKAGLNTLLGMGTVFVVLIFLAFLISLMKYIPVLMNFFEKKDKEAEAKEAVQTETVAETAELTDDLELIAVITAAIAAQEGTSTDGFVVRSIRRRTSNNW